MKNGKATWQSGFVSEMAKAAGESGFDRWSGKSYDSEKLLWHNGNLALLLTVILEKEML